MSIAPGANPGIIVNRISGAASNFLENGNTDFAAQQGIPAQVQMNKLFNNSTFCLLPSILWFEDLPVCFAPIIEVLEGGPFKNNIPHGCLLFF